MALSSTCCVGITGGEQELSYGVTVSFGATTGHAVGDSWVFNVGSARPDVLEVTTSGNEGAYPSGVPSKATQRSPCAARTSCRPMASSASSATI